MATPIPQNRAAFTRAEMLAATGGELVHGSAEGATAISTDTRAITPGACFVALRGEVHDGHKHLAAAAAKGAIVAVVDRDVEAPPGLAIVRVKDTLIALGDLARAHAQRWRSRGERRRIVAITGSAGKTTTRVAVSALLEELSPAGTVYASRGNLNNRVGVPMVLFGLEDAHEIAVIEMGMNQPGEIAELCRIAEPEVGVVTLIAAAHTEGLGSIAAVAEEKGALFRALPEGGIAVANADDARVVRQLGRATAQRRYLYGRAENADRRILSRDPIGMTSSRVRVGDAEFTTPLLGEAGALACAAAIAVAELAFELRVTSAACEAGFARADVGAGAGRLVPRVLGDGLAVIDDTYNANPASTCASILAAAEIARATKRRLVLVLGEMKELGDESRRGHNEVGEVAAESGAAEVFVVGEGDSALIAMHAAIGGIAAAHAGRVEDVATLVLDAVEPNDLVLVKGSRSIGTERVVSALAAAHAGGSAS